MTRSCEAVPDPKLFQASTRQVIVFPRSSCWTSYVAPAVSSLPIHRDENPSGGGV